LTDVPTKHRSPLISFLAAVAFLAILLATTIGVVRYFVFDQGSVVVLPQTPALQPVSQARNINHVGKTADVTAMLPPLIKNNSLTTAASNAQFGDPAPGKIKTLRVNYTIDGVSGVRSADENKSLTIAAAPGKKLEIQKAVYGDLPTLADSRAPGDIAPNATVGAADVTTLLRNAISKNSLNITASNDALGGDPAFGIDKRLIVHYTVAGQAHSVSVKENDTLKIPASRDGAGALVIIKAIWAGVG